MLEAMDSYTRHMMNSSSAMDKERQYRVDEARSEYASDTYSGMASDANAEALRELDQATIASNGQNRAVHVDWAMADTLRSLVRSLKLLPRIPVVSLPVADTKTDSFLVSATDTLTVNCARAQATQ